MSRKVSLPAVAPTRVSVPPPPIRIWLARFDQTQIRYPGKLEAQTTFATIRGRILYFRERALTQEESQAIRK